MKKIIINKNKCIGCMTCCSLAPDIFKLGKDGKAEVINQDFKNRTGFKNIIDSCPVGAITIK